MTGQPGISIYIITYLDSKDRCRVLESTCKSALAQNYPKFEVIVSDNAGTIKAEDALATIKDPRLKIYRNEKNLGMAGNMNCCLERCSFDIFKLNCDDDLLHPDSLARSVPWVDDETFVIHDMEKFAIGTTPDGIGRAVLENPPVIERQPGYRTDFWKLGYDSLPGNTLCTRNLFSALGGYDTGSDVDDWDFGMRARLKKRVVNIKCVLCYQGVWGFSLTEQMLKNEPYYFQQAGLRTHFKIMRDPSLKAGDRFHVGLMILREFILNTLRLLKYCAHPQYRSGYSDYMKSLKREMMPKISQ